MGSRFSTDVLRRALGLLRGPGRDAPSPLPAAGPAASPPQPPAWRAFLKTREGELPDWQAILAGSAGLWRECLARAAGGPRVLVATYVGGHPQLTVLESVVAAALTLRGARVETLLCDGVLPACLRAKIAALRPDSLERYELRRIMCDGCMARGDAVFEPLGLGLARLGAHLAPGEAEQARLLATAIPAGEIAGYRLEGWPLGEHALAGALRFFGRGDLDTEPKGEAVLRRYLEASLLTARSLDRLVRERGYEVAVMNHGIYVPHGIASAVCRAAGVRVVTWNLAYRRSCAIFSHDDTYHHTMLSEPTSGWEAMSWSPEREKLILDYLDSRRRGSRDWIWFNDNPDEDMDGFAARTGLDWSRPVVGLLTNVVWDAQLHYPANAFPNMVDWVLRTVAYFEARPELQLLIRVHPGELAPPGGVTKSRQPIVEEIRGRFPRLPANVFVVPPESPTSTYAAMARCDAVLIYGTKTGVELASLGVPVIVGGEAWIRNKGLTLDASTAEEYFALLDRLPLRARMDERTVARARRYAFHFFFRRMVPLPFLEPVQAQPPFLVSVRGLEDLLPGRHPGLDVICDGILKGTPFVYPAERLGLHDA